MKAIVYYISLPFIYLIAYLPFPLLFAFSDFLCFIIFRVIGYRKKVVRQNLINSFPNKSVAELKAIETKFYTFFCDLTLETLKTLVITPSTLAKRVSFEGKEIFEEYYKQNQSVIVVMGHYGNWELGGARFAIESAHQLYIIYQPLQNLYFDKLVYKMRTRLGNGLYSKNTSLRGILANRKNVTATAFIADQTPPRVGAHWLTFLNQDTGFFMGTGKIATKLKSPVVYMGIDRIRRGYHKMKAEELIADASKITAEEVVEIFAKRLEKDIQRMPEIWLWSHNRWKRKRILENPE